MTYLIFSNCKVVYILAVQATPDKNKQKVNKSGLLQSYILRA